MALTDDPVRGHLPGFSCAWEFRRRDWVLGAVVGTDRCPNYRAEPSLNWRMFSTSFHGDLERTPTAPVPLPSGSSVRMGSGNAELERHSRCQFTGSRAPLAGRGRIGISNDLPQPADSRDRPYGEPEPAAGLTSALSRDTTEHLCHIDMNERPLGRSHLSGRGRRAQTRAAIE